MRARNHVVKIVVGLFLGLVLPSCGTITVDLPKQFMETESSETDFKATTADDAIFWVERYGVPEKGENLEFWTDAVKNDFVENRGYTPIGEDRVQTAAGRSGSQLEFEATTQGQTYRYLVAVFVAPGSWFSSPNVFVARFTAIKPVYDKHVADVKTAVRTLRF